MKKTLLLILTVLSCFKGYASHVQGGELRYEYTGAAYKVELTLFADCGAPVPTGATQTVLLKSAACNTTTNLIVTRYAIDTLFEMYCPSTSVSCAGLLSYRIINHYSAMVPTIAPCNDWKFSFTEGSRSGSIINLSQPSAQNLYLEAFLNNSTAPNSSPVFGNDPVLVSPVNTPTTNPFQLLDIEGDSISSAMYQPQSLSGTAIPYNVGYSLAAPFGTGSYTTLNTTAGLLSMRSATTGSYSLAARAYDYRNGVLVGYSSRDWVNSVMSYSNVKTPLPAVGSSFLTNACPGSTSTLNVHFTDSLLTDSVFITVVPQNNFTYTTTYAPGIASATATTTWVTPASLNPAVTPYYFLKVKVRDNNCPVHGFATYTVLVKTAACNADSVWPGDANADKIVNLYDPLFVALAWNDTGIARTVANTTWMPHVCSPWTQTFNTGINKKHADCDGNGVVNNADLSAITANYGQVHLRGSAGESYRGAGLPDLYYDLTGITAIQGATVNIPVKLGSSSAAMTSMLGLSARMKITGITPSGLSLTYPISWIGTASNTLRFARNNSTNSMDWSYARIDHQQVVGQGQIATLTFTIPHAITSNKIILQMEGVKIIDADGRELTGYNVLSDTLIIMPTAIGTLNGPGFQATVVPNPSRSNAALALSTDKAMTMQIYVTDLTGRTVWNITSEKTAGNRSILLPATLHSGMYLVRIAAGNETTTLKWVKAE